MDNKNNTGSQDDKRINVNQDHEIRYWTEKLGVSKEELEEAVKEVGTMVDDDREFLNRR